MIEHGRSGHILLCTGILDMCWILGLNGVIDYLKVHIKISLNRLDLCGHHNQCNPIYLILSSNFILFQTFNCPKVQNKICV